MRNIKVSKNRLFEAVTEILKRKDINHAAIYLMYHPRYGVRIRYYGAIYNKERLPFMEGVEYLNITDCFSSEIPILITSTILSRIESWLNIRIT